VRAEEIVDRIAREYGFTREEILAADRHKSVTYARHLAMFFCRLRTGMSFPELGGVFERDHSTVMSGVRRIADRLNGADLARCEKALDPETRFRVVEAQPEGSPVG